MQQRRAARSTDSEVRERLIGAARDLIAEGGVEALTSRSITNRAAENLGSITYYFGSKEALVTEALTRTARELVTPVLDTLTDPSVEPTARLFDAIRMLTHAAATNQAALDVYIQALATAAHNEDVAAPLRSLHDHITGALAIELESLIATGRIPTWARPGAMAQLIIALVNGVALGIAATPQTTNALDIGQQFGVLLTRSDSPNPP